MDLLVSRVLKYVLIFLMLIYVYLSYSAGVGGVRRRRAKLVSQNVVMLLVFSICTAIVLYNRPGADYAVLSAFEFIFLIVFVVAYRLVYQNSSPVLINNIAMLLSIGFIMVIRLSPDNAFKQFMIVLAGSVLALLVKPVLKHKDRLIKIGPVYTVAGLLLLMVTLILGKTTWGANISIDIFGFTFQPSEFVKILFVFQCAVLLRDIGHFSSVVLSAILAAAHVIILILSNDLGAALIFFVVYISMLYVSTGQVRYLLAGGLCAVAASILAYRYVSHVRVRINAWLDPWSIIETGGYQITQSLFAIGTGGLFGLGLFMGTPGKIPVVVKDFVFSAISEELGLLFAMGVVLVCFSCFLNMMRNASQIRDVFYKLIVLGFAVLYAFQCFLSVGGAVKFIPSTGVTLPFVSYGGSSILCSLIMFSIVIAINNLHNEEKRLEEEKEVEG